MFKASHDFIILSLDGFHAVEHHLEEGQNVTALSNVDHYIGRPNSSHFNTMTFLEYARQYSMPKTSELSQLPGVDILLFIPRLYVSPNLSGEK